MIATPMYGGVVLTLATALLYVFAKPPSSSTYQQMENAAREMTQTLADVKNVMFPRHCADLHKAGPTTSGVYTLFHYAAGPDGQKVYCDMETDGGGWTVIQRRGQFGNSVFYFKRKWEEYERGFGEVAKEYWIGNSALHALTMSYETMTLRVVLANTTEDSVKVDYASVRVDSKAEEFKIHIGDFLGPEGWDSLSACNEMIFTTFDRDDSGCAGAHRGGWWYSNCYVANLNGLNFNGYYEDVLGGIDWGRRGAYHGLYNYSYPSVLMAIRPDDFLNK